MLDKVIFFDGECGLCNRVVDLIIRVDTLSVFYFSSIQSTFATHFLKKKGIEIKLDTLYFYYNQQVYDRSSAIRQIFLCLKGYWYWIGMLMGLIPKLVRDYFYKLISRNRFKLFGENTCRLLTEKEKKQFLE